MKRRTFLKAIAALVLVPKSVFDKKPDDYILVELEPPPPMKIEIKEYGNSIAYDGDFEPVGFGVDDEALKILNEQIRKTRATAMKLMWECVK